MLKLNIAIVAFYIIYSLYQKCCIIADFIITKLEEKDV